jgi:hypothetical protein
MVKTPFTRIAISIADPELVHRLRVAAHVEQRVPESAIAEVALREFLGMPKDKQAKALAGIGRRRKRNGVA